jgi:hypothetical protein
MTEPKCFKIVKKEIWEQEVFVTALNKKAALELARAGHYEILNDPKYTQDYYPDGWVVKEEE